MRERPMRRGEVWRVRIPFAPRDAQAGDRPALVLENDLLIASLPTVLVIPLTSTPGAARFPLVLVNFIAGEDLLRAGRQCLDQVIVM
jgi:mRNA-degrading endonuclease toxin of MazEF toxin-antitoxin module